MMSEEQYKIVDLKETLAISDNGECKYYQNDNDCYKEVCKVLNKQNKEIKYWKENAMTLLLQVRRLLPRMTEKEIIEYEKELERIER